MSSAPPFAALVGPTASGKTDISIELAERLGAEIVSVDSMLVYRGMDVGTAKPTTEDRARVRHHLIDVAEPREPLSVARYQQLAHAASSQIRRRGARELLVGGSGLYFRAAVDDLEFPETDHATRAELEDEARAAGAARLYERLSDLDPVAATRIEPTNVRRTVRALEVAAITGREFSSYASAWERYPADRVRAAGVDLPRASLEARVRERVRAMVRAGFIEEVERLVARGLSDWLTSSRAIGYAEIARHLAGELTLQEAIDGTVKRTKNLARRQRAWFRRDPRIRWFQPDERGLEPLVDALAEYLAG